MTLFNEDQSSALAELVTIGIGRAASSLNDMIQMHVVLSVPTIELVAADKIVDLLGWGPEQIARVRQPFGGQVSGSASLLFMPGSANILAGLMLGLDPADESTQDEIEIERDAVLTEIGNVLINGVLGSIANGIGHQLDYRLPEYRLMGVDDLQGDVQKQGEDAPVLAVSVSFSVSDTSVDGHVLIIFDVGTMPLLRQALEALMDP